MADFRIYYADGSTYSDTDGPAHEAPGLGVLCIAQRDNRDPGGREILHGDGARVVDYFWWENGVWLSGDFAGVIQYLARPDWGKVLVGRNIDNRTFTEAMNRAANDPL